MSETSGPVSDDELHAYVDQRIDAARRVEIERYLLEHPDIAARVAAYQRQAALLRAAFTPIAGEPVPPRLRLDQIIQESLGRRLPLWRYAAMIVIGLGMGVAGGWYLHDLTRRDSAASARESLERQAFATYDVYSADDRHPVEVPAAEQDHLRQWLSDQLHRPVVPPDLSVHDYRLLGGRLVAAESGRPGALFMYDAPQHGRLTVIMQLMPANLNAPMADVARGAVHGCVWIDDGLGYAVVAAVPENEMDQIATQIMAGRNPPPPPSH